MPDDMLQQLIDQPRESESVEVKNWLDGLSDNAERARLAKEIIALANFGGGHIVIGFEDDEGEGHQPIEPTNGQREEFSQDGISAVVHRFCTPAIQCNVELRRQADGQILHPIITVPPANDVPVFASRQSPDNQTLQTGAVYVRRVGGHSEPCRTQDDWERLLRRLVFARQEQLVGAIRNVLNPAQDFGPQAQAHAFEDWIRESREQRELLLVPYPRGHPLRLEQGHYEVAFYIEPFGPPEIGELRERLDRNRPLFGGWGPFEVSNEGGSRPVPQGDTIQAWLGNNTSGGYVDPVFSDFWRLSRQGMGFLLRGMQEDDPNYRARVRLLHDQDRHGFDWEFPSERMTECLHMIRWLGVTFANAEAQFRLRVTYFGTEGRRLTNNRFLPIPRLSPETTQDKIESDISGRIGEIALNTEEMIHSLLEPVFAQFSFAELPKNLVDEAVRVVMRECRER